MGNPFYDALPYFMGEHKGQRFKSTETHKNHLQYPHHRRVIKNISHPPQSIIVVNRVVQEIENLSLFESFYY